MDCSIDGLNYFIEIDYDLQDKNSVFYSEDYHTIEHSILCLILCIIIIIK